MLAFLERESKTVGKHELLKKFKIKVKETLNRKFGYRRRCKKKHLKFSIVFCINVIMKLKNCVLQNSSSKSDSARR